MNNDKKPLWEKKNCRTSSSHCCCGNVYQGDIHHPHFLGDFAKAAMLFLSFATNPIFALFIEKLKKFQQPPLVGGVPAPGLSGHFQPKSSCGCKRVWNLGSWWEFISRRALPVTKGAFERFNTGLQPEGLWYVLKTMLGLCFSLWFWCSWMCSVFLMLCSAIRGGKC